MNNTGLIINREYRQRVGKKSFIITTIIMPVFMLLLMVAPAAIMALGGQSKSEVLVLDGSGIIAQRLESDDDTRFVSSDITVDSALRRDNVSAVLVIPREIAAKNNPGVKLYTNGPSSMSLESNIRQQINSIIEDARLQEYNISDLDKILESVRSDVMLQTIRADKEDLEATSSELSFGLGIMLTFVLYMFLLLYGQMVMTSIIEEKNNRVLEIVVSSVKPTQMMLGKIIGIGLVALTQVVIWAVLLVAMATFLVPAILPAEAMADIAAVNAGNYAAVSDPDSLGIVKAVAALTNVGFLLNILITLTLFLIAGFLFYAALYAAVGSSVDNINDASQLTTVIVLPVIFGMVFSMQAANDPNSSVAFWMSMIPFTSPMVMMARVPFGIPAWEITLSLGILILSLVVMIWFAAKVYRVGIFMYGKKPTIKDLVRWIKYK